MQPDRHIDKPNRDAPAPEWPPGTALVRRFIRKGFGDDQGWGLVFFSSLLSGNRRRNDNFWPGISCAILFRLALW
jgi:hypothetical protein